MELHGQARGLLRRRYRAYKSFSPDFACGRAAAIKSRILDVVTALKRRRHRDFLISCKNIEHLTFIFKRCIVYNRTEAPHTTEKGGDRLCR